ncbi:MAG: ATP synthase F1 subunit epsilon [Eggerthellaceae bacterium]|jgi:F-type H+-transporting ATPase subunit epsilon
MSKIACDIVHLNDRVYRNNEVSMVVVPGRAGEMGFMEGHVPVLSRLNSGVVRVHLQDDSIKRFVTQGGYAYCTGDRVFVLVDRGIAVDDVDLEGLKDEEAELKQRIDAEEEGSIKKRVLERKLRWVYLRRDAKQEQDSL